MTSPEQAPSASLAQPEYWWYRARSELLRVVLEPSLAAGSLVLDVGSADGPSVSWMGDGRRRVALDLHLEALAPGDVCGSAMQLPFRDGAFDTVAAFDVLEHCSPEADAIAELTRVLRPGGSLLLAVPAYQWAWTSFDVAAGHHRRYTRRRLVRAVTAAGLDVRRSTHIFAGTFPLFVAARGARRLRRPSDEAGTSLPEVPRLAERLLLGLCGLEERVLQRRDLPFGSSVVLAATKSR